jgi:apolipoprotein N-acyltransferase
MKGAFRHILLALLSGILLSAAWGKFTFTIFFALIPLLWIEHDFRYCVVRFRKWKLFGLFYLSFLSWNLITTWWIVNSTVFGAAMAIICNSLFMAMIWLAFNGIARKVKSFYSYVSLIAFWISFEYLHYNWELAWPWLTLGNSLATQPNWIQWYEYTGVFGGSLWILCSNIFLFFALKNYSEQKPVIKFLAIAGDLILVPYLFSQLTYSFYSDKGKPVNVVIVQPNVDPYREKFNGTGALQLARILQLASTVADSTTDYIIAPETALPDGIWEENFKTDKNISTIRAFISALPNTAFVTGASTFHAYSETEKRSATARKFKDSNQYYDAYNTALQISQDTPVQSYHKSKLVPGVERMPYPALFGFLDKYSIDMGGMSGSLGTQDVRSVFAYGEHKAAPVICYESIFGDFLSGYVRNGAEMFFIVTNDGWWGNTPGHKQHLKYASICAIQFRKSIARSANTGISCTVNQRGDILNATRYWEEAVFPAVIRENDSKTFYAKHGNYIGIVLLFAAAIIILLRLLKVKSMLRISEAEISQS